MSTIDALLDELRDEEKARRFWGGEGVVRIAGGDPSLRLVLLQALLGGKPPRNET